MNNDRKRTKFSFLSNVIESINSIFSSVLHSKLGWRAIPILVVLIAISMFFVFSTLVPAIAPFVYTLF